MPRLQTPASPFAPSRRHLLGGIAGGMLGWPAFAQSAPGAGEASATLEARTLTARLGEGDGPESRLFRLLGTTGAGAATTDSLLRLKPGSEARLALINRLDQPLSLGLRGLRAGLNHAPALVEPAGRGLLGFAARQSGSFLFFPTTPERASEQTARGLAQLLVIDESAPPPVDLDVPLLLGDWRLDAGGVLEEGFGDPLDAARFGRLGNRLAVNGRAAPLRLTVRPGARIRVRIANTALARIFPLHAAGLQARVIAIDSTPCQPFDPLQRRVTLAPGTRCELIVDLPPEPDREARIEARFGNPAPLMVFRTEGMPIAPRGPVPPLPDPGLPPAIRLQDAQRADVTISGGLTREQDAALQGEPGLRQQALGRTFPDPKRIFLINGGAVGDRAGEQAGLPLLRVRRGRVVVLALRNQTASPQVLGIGGHSFRLLHPYDDGWEPYFLDTLYLAPGSVARVAFIAETQGRHAIRSTIADHAEAGVSTHFEVV